MSENLDGPDELADFQLRTPITAALAELGNDRLTPAGFNSAVILALGELEAIQNEIISKTGIQITTRDVAGFRSRLREMLALQ